MQPISHKDWLSARLMDALDATVDFDNARTRSLAMIAYFTGLANGPTAAKIYEELLSHIGKKEPKP